MNKPTIQEWESRKFIIARDADAPSRKVLSVVTGLSTAIREGQTRNIKLKQFVKIEPLICEGQIYD